MITEDYVSFKTAKLLKEKGFDSECDYLYADGLLMRASAFACDWNKGETLFADYKNECSAPTLQMVMKWLRKKHNLVVNPVGHYVDGKLESWEVDIYFLDCGVDATTDAMGHIYGKTYESACENGIKYCLENLI